jgi:ferredoxin/flavodoxin---NADP+ reductase
MHWVKGVVVASHRWNERLFSLCFEAPIGDHKAGQFVKLGLDIDGERVGRPYSLVNPPGRAPCEVYFNRVPEGPLSRRLASLGPGDELWVSPGGQGFFTLDEVPAASDLWLLATGTALGVFLAILDTEEAWRRFSTLVLVHGVRSADELTYRERIDALLAAHPGRFRYAPYTSREHVAGAGFGRLTVALADGSLEARVGRRIAPGGQSHVMLCGNAGMIAEATALLETHGLHRHRRREPGHYTVEKYH